MCDAHQSKTFQDVLLKNKVFDQYAFLSFLPKVNLSMTCAVDVRFPFLGFGAAHGSGFAGATQSCVFFDQRLSKSQEGANHREGEVHEFRDDTVAAVSVLVRVLMKASRGVEVCVYLCVCVCVC